MVALLNCVLNLLSIVIPVRDFIPLVQDLASRVPLLAWGFTATIVAIIVVGLLFFAAVAANPVPLRLPHHLRLLALGAAAMFFIINYRAFGLWAFAIRDDWSFLRQFDWRSGAPAIRELLASREIWVSISSSANLSAIVMYALLLAAIFRPAAADSNDEANASKAFSWIVRISLIVMSLVMAFLLVRIAIAPYTYSQFRPIPGRRLPSFWLLVGLEIRDLLHGFCYFVAPLLVWIGLKRPLHEIPTNLSDDSLMQ